eukprot:CAMPEP_0113693174 /NCGR_PEP_ID=MMETSP0038_2-20120614/19518_1 /TAXON_ID=2898 /ORGANISM="Cryptomonas paramecium" /LENGTH=250 /DNA_ID=CAMNT_0000615217 /DNA_START=56 /DNA_END=805 /DNA_ORIENTATION=- /assembly_acc=CAM_ASM_000170
MSSLQSARACLSVACRYVKVQGKACRPPSSFVQMRPRMMSKTQSTQLDMQVSDINKNPEHTENGFHCNNVASRPSVCQEAVRVIRGEAMALQALADRIDSSFEEAVELIEAMPRGGRVLVCGVGKSGHVARKIAATLSSSGTPALFLHAAEALHGDLGMVSPGDVGLLLSNSGTTEETLAAGRAMRKLGARLVAMSASRDSPLARESDVALSLGRIPELDHNGLAPTASTAAMMALGDALAVVLSRRLSF